MPDTLRVRVYNVGFGDAILVSIPDKGATTTTKRHLLIDFGNLSAEGGDDRLFEPVIDDIIKELKGRPLDLFVMTHEHMDHVQGMLYCKEKLAKRFDVAFAWLTASAKDNYYATHRKAKKKKELARAAYAAAVRHLDAAAGSTAVRMLLLNNDPSTTTDCVTHLKKRLMNGSKRTKTYYVHRVAKLQGKHPFHEAKIEIWAPEEDTSDYYGRFQPSALAANGAGTRHGADIPATAVLPPAGVDAGAFYDLVAYRQDGYGENLRAIDRANNDTSIVLCLEWRGWRLLFAGDAEERSWKTMDREGVLKPVDFLKVSHHGSHNGTPDGSILDKVLTMPRPQRRDAAVSTCFVSSFNKKNEVPDPATLGELRRRCQRVKRTDKDGSAESWLDFEFTG